MRSKGKMVGWGFALATAAALTLTIAVHPGFGSPGAIAASTTATAASPGATGRALTSAQMRSVLVPLSAQPASTSVSAMTLRDAANSFPLPPNHVYSPKACLSYIYDIVGPATALDGWIQFGTRTATGQKFIQWVVNLPSGADVGAIEASAARCTSGTVTLQGTVTGTINLTQSRAPQLAGARSFSLTTSIQFNEKIGTKGAQVLADELSLTWSAPDVNAQQSQANFNAQQTLSNVTDFAANGRTLMVVVEADQATADQIAGAMARNVDAVVGH